MEATTWDIGSTTALLAGAGYVLARFVWQDVRSFLNRKNGHSQDASQADIVTELRGLRADVQGLRGAFELGTESTRRMQAELTTMARQAVVDIKDVVGGQAMESGRQVAGLHASIADSTAILARIDGRLER